MNSLLPPIAYQLPPALLTNDELSSLYEGWSAEKIFKKTGIRTRHVAAPGECASDLAEQAARTLFAEYSISPSEVDFLLFGTQSPDYILPTTACLLQSRLGIPTASGAIDFNLGCSAYVYGLALAQGLCSGQIARNVLLLVGETYSKHIHPLDKSARTIFGDAAAATLIRAQDLPKIGRFVLRTDGSGAPHLMIPAGGARRPLGQGPWPEQADESGNVRTQAHLFMDGPAIFDFTISVMPQLLQDTLEANRLRMEQIDLFVFHQANRFMLDFLRDMLGIPADRFYVNIADCGNTVSATIPIALKRAEEEGRIRAGNKIFLAGFGVGLSWGAVVLTV